MGSCVPIPSQAAASLEQPSVSTSAPWSGRILAALVLLFLLFGDINKVMIASLVLAAGVRPGLLENRTVAITPLVCTFLHAIPRPSIPGAILLTGYLGGAVSIQRRVGNSSFSQTLFPVYSVCSCGLDGISGEAHLRAPVPLRS